jgi:hypothetical protein
VVETKSWNNLFQFRAKIASLAYTSWRLDARCLGGFARMEDDGEADDDYAGALDTLEAGRRAADALPDETSTEVVDPEVVNVIATFETGCRLDLKQITLHTRSTEYNPRRFSAAVMRLRSPRTVAMVCPALPSCRFIFSPALTCA